MTPNEFFTAKETMLAVLNELRAFELGTSAATALLFARHNDGVTFSELRFIMHSDAATNALNQLDKEGYLSLYHGSDRRFKNYNITEKGCIAADVIAGWLKDY